jgi:hypothetical protein
MIYCVIPQPLADELYDRLSDYYRDDPNVQVIIDRRDGPDRRRRGEPAPEGERREVRDRRQRRPVGSFPPTKGV